METPPEDKDEPVPKKFKASSPTPSSDSASSTVFSATPRQPPTKHFIPPWEVGALAGIPSYELGDSEMKKYYCLICGNGRGNHDSVLAHVCCIHLNIFLGMPLLQFHIPSLSTLKKHVSNKHAGLPVQAAPPSEEQKLETTVIMATLPQ